LNILGAFFYYFGEIFYFINPVGDK